MACPVRDRREQQLLSDRRSRCAAAGLDPLGQGRGRRAGRPRLGSLPRGQRADRRRLFADGVGERQPGQAALVHASGPGRRFRQPPSRRLRQRLPGSAGVGAVVSDDPVGALAHTGDRNADDDAIPVARAPAGAHPSGAGAGLRRPARNRRGHLAGSGRRPGPAGLLPGSGRLPQRRTGLPGGRRAGVLGGRRPGGGAAVGAGRRRARAHRAALPPRPDPTVEPRMDQRRRGWRAAGQPGHVRRRIDGLRQRPRRAAVGHQQR